jgi:Zn-dependent protease with chaperone function
MEPLDPAPHGGSVSRSPVPGPVDRESFFEAQRRHRRATWRLSAVCVGAVAVMGIPLSLVLTPVLYALVLLLAHLVDLVAPVPDGFWQALAALASLMIQIIGGFLGEDAPASPTETFVGLTVMLLPGAVVMVLIWLSLHSLFLRAGVRSVLLAMEARDPRDGDPEERQLVNVVEEMAVAAGVRPPSVMLIDSNAANAAVVGSSDATVVVSRRMLDELDRDETQGVIGHLVGSTGNGDLRISLIIASVFQAYGLLITLVDTPFGAESRAALMRLVRFAMGRGRSAARDAEAVAVMAMLTRHLGMEGEDDLDRFMDADQRQGDSVLRSFRTVLLLPVLFTNLAIKVTLWITVSFMLGPLIALMWRARRYLADATAVQLTRYPDGLARALQRLGSKGATIPGSSWATHLFVIGPEGSQGEARSTVEGGVATGSLLTFHPPLKRRLKRLRRLGATLPVDEDHSGRGSVVGNVLAVVIVGPLVAVVAGLLLCLAAIIIGLDLLFMGVAMAVIHGLFSLI